MTVAEFIKTNNLVPDCMRLDKEYFKGIDFNKLTDEIKLSKKYLSRKRSSMYLVRNYKTIISGAYRDFPKTIKVSSDFDNQRSYTAEQLANVITPIEDIEW